MDNNYTELARHQIVKVYDENGNVKRYARMADLMTPIYSKESEATEDSFLVEESKNTFCEFYKTIKGENMKSNVVFKYNENI